MSKTRFGTLFQQDFSLLTGEERANPINPLHPKPTVAGVGYVSIGGRLVRVEPARHWTAEELNADTTEWNAARRRRGHECASMEVGEHCTHYIPEME